MTNTLFPGSTIGIIGDYPNGIMLSREAKRMGYKVIAYSQYEESPTLAESDVKMIGSFNDQNKLQNFAQRCDIIVYESDKIDSEIIKLLSEYTRVPQSWQTLEIMQDRLLERAFFEQLNINIAPYATIINLDDIYQAITSIGYPCILKPIQKILNNGHQQIISRQADIAKCSDIIDKGTYILESLVNYTKELSVTLTKDIDNNINFFPIVENVYYKNKLCKTLIPVKINDDIEKEILRLSTKIAQNLQYIGTMQISFFLTSNGAIYVKKVIPSICKSGYVFDKATNVSMFEQHLRAVSNMPLVKVKLLEPVISVLVDDDSIELLKTQWVLKNNWFYNLFRYPASMKRYVSYDGYILAVGPNIRFIDDQIDSTDILKN